MKSLTSGEKDKQKWKTFFDFHCLSTFMHTHVFRQCLHQLSKDLGQLGEKLNKVAQSLHTKTEKDTKFFNLPCRFLSVESYCSVL